MKREAARRYVCNSVLFANGKEFESHALPPGSAASESPDTSTAGPAPESSTASPTSAETSKSLDPSAAGGAASFSTSHKGDLLTSSSLTLEQTSQVGTIRYMAPEMFTSDEKAKYTEYVDIFSLAMVFYYVFERTPPSVENAMNPPQHMQQIQLGKRPAFTSRTPKAARTVISQCWVAEPSQRPQAIELQGLWEAAKV